LVNDKPRYKLPLTPDEQVELLGALLSVSARVQRLEALNEELNRQLQIVILDFGRERELRLALERRNEKTAL
jgi:hypothetical protein